MPRPRDDSIPLDPLMVKPNRFIISLLETRQIDKIVRYRVNAIKRIPILKCPKPDRLIWLGDSKGKISVKSSYKVNQEFNTTTQALLCNQIWKIKGQNATLEDMCQQIANNGELEAKDWSCK